MKVIDLLNKIENGEEAPKTIKYRERIFYYDDIDYFNTDIGYLFERYAILEILNDEVEIIEEEKKIEKINVWYEYDGKNDKELVKIMLDELKDKINEIIEVINGRD